MPACKLDEELLAQIRDEEATITVRAIDHLGAAIDQLLLHRGVHESSLRPLVKHLRGILKLVRNNEYLPTEETASAFKPNDGDA